MQESHSNPSRSRIRIGMRPHGASLRPGNRIRAVLPLIVSLALTLAWATPGQCSWHTWRVGDGLASNNVYSMLEDRSGALWFGTYGGGVSRYDGVSWRTFTTADGLASNNVSSMLEDRSGTLWFGSYYGVVSRYDGVSWRTFTTADGLASNGVSSMLEDKSGALWFGTGGGGDGTYPRSSGAAQCVPDTPARRIREPPPLDQLPSRIQ